MQISSMTNESQIPAINSLIDTNISHSNSLMTQTPTRFEFQSSNVFTPHFNQTPPYIRNISSGHYLQFPNNMNYPYNHMPSNDFFLKQTSLISNSFDHGFQNPGEKAQGYITIGKISQHLLLQTINIKT